MDKLKAFYTKCMNCNNTTQICPSTWKNFKKGIPPRGFHFESAKVELLVVGKNPGHPLKGEEKYFIGKTGKQLYNAYMKLHSIYYKDLNTFKEPSNTFHKNLFRYLSFFLDVPESKIYSKAAHTNLVKCSSRSERGKLKQLTINECYTKYFLEELTLFKPKVLLALGKEVFNFLQRRKTDFNIPIVYIKHPSYFYRKEEEQGILEDKKSEIRQYF